MIAGRKAETGRRNPCPMCGRTMTKTIGAWTGEDMLVCRDHHGVHSIYRDDPEAYRFDWTVEYED